MKALDNRFYVKFIQLEIGLFLILCIYMVLYRFSWIKFEISAPKLLAMPNSSPVRLETKNTKFQGRVIAKSNVTSP